jgi:hypothetical protein
VEYKPDCEREINDGETNYIKIGLESDNYVLLGWYLYLDLLFSELPFSYFYMYLLAHMHALWVTHH